MKTTNAAVVVNGNALALLRISVGLIYFWFGVLKFFHGFSPAEDLAANTINKLTFGLMPQHLTVILLAAWECAVGILLMAGKWLRTVLVFLFIHMTCTFTPLIFFPSLSFNFPPYGFTLVGQYIMKNIIIICAGIVLWPNPLGAGTAPGEPIPAAGMLAGSEQQG